MMFWTSGFMTFAEKQQINYFSCLLASFVCGE